MAAMDYHERSRLFRAHASAVLTGDTAQTARTQHLIYPDHHLAHYVFTFSIFATCVRDRFGTDLDWADLDTFITDLARAFPAVSAIKTEALIRVIYGQTSLYFEVPLAEHPESMWATCQLILHGQHTQDELDALFDRAEDTGRDLARGIYNTDHTPTPEPEPPEPEPPEPEPAGPPEPPEPPGPPDPAGPPGPPGSAGPLEPEPLEPEPVGPVGSGTDPAPAGQEAP